MGPVSPLPNGKRPEVQEDAAVVTASSVLTSAPGIWGAGRPSRRSPVKPQVLDGFDAEGQPILRDATSLVTLRNLLTHTSGYVDDVGNEDMGKWCEVSGTPPTHRVRRASRFGQVDEGGAAQLARCTAMSVASSVRPHQPSLQITPESTRDDQAPRFRPVFTVMNSAAILPDG